MSDTLFDFPCSPTFRALEAEMQGIDYEPPPDPQAEAIMRRRGLDKDWEAVVKRYRNLGYGPEPRPKVPARRPRQRREAPPAAPPKPPKKLDGPPLPSGRTTWT